MLEQHEIEQLAQAKKRWEEKTLKPALQRGPERTDQPFATSSLSVERLYSPLDAGEAGYREKIGFPGEYPFTRGIQPTMYRGRLWTMRQYAGFGTATESNEKFKYLLSQGQTGLSVAFDLPTQLGYDSDHPMAEGEVGKVGVAIDSLRDMETMFSGIPLDQVSCSMTINAPAAVLLAMYVAVGEQQGVPADKLEGTVQNDVLKEYIARGTYIYPPGPSLRLAADLMAYCSRHVPRWNTISISGYHMRDAGCTAVQEMAFTFANAKAYVDEALKTGLSIDDFAPRISWIFNTHNDFFEEVAKYRALRRMWAKLMREHYRAKDPRSWMLRTHTQTGGSTLTAQQPENNITRAAIQALAAVLGGVQSMALSCYDEALAIPTDHAQRIALRTQQIIAYETGAANTVDPLAGSYYVEHLTDRLEREAWAYLERIAQMGGAVAALESGYIQREIQEAAVRYQQEIEEGSRIIVGVNRFQIAEERSPAIFRVDPRVTQTQVERLRRYRKERDQGAALRALAELKDVACGADNLMPPILAAVKAYATLGEICGAMREVFGDYHPPTVI
ncbi:MAG: methylmalonyl-CoA mutase family protein [Chloroflexi bacterium]|nr:methylmalonyl-CoA mutase family protein [Chloroflexota bacterium]